MVSSQPFISHEPLGFFKFLGIEKRRYLLEIAPYVNRTEGLIRIAGIQRTFIQLEVFPCYPPKYHRPQMAVPQGDGLRPCGSGGGIPNQLIFFRFWSLYRIDRCTPHTRYYDEKADRKTDVVG